MSKCQRKNVDIIQGDTVEVYFELENFDLEAIKNVQFGSDDAQFYVDLPYSEDHNAFCLRLESEFTQTLEPVIGSYDLIVECVDGSKVVAIHEGGFGVFKSRNTPDKPETDPITVKVYRTCSVLPNDYTRLSNLPKINGVTVLGSLTSNQLGILSSNKDDYKTASFNDTKNDYLIVLGAGNTSKMKVADLVGVDGYGFRTTKVIDKDALIGSYQFVEKK